jgi:hypothetical protein
MCICVFMCVRERGVCVPVCVATLYTALPYTLHFTTDVRGRCKIQCTDQCTRAENRWGEFVQERIRGLDWTDG